MHIYPTPMLINNDESRPCLTITGELPRIYKRGAPPRIVLTQEVLQIAEVASIPDSSRTLAYVVLNRLYNDKKFSQSKIAKLFDVQRETVNRWLKRVGIPLLKSGDAVSRSLLKHRKVPFSNNPLEKAYLIGLRCGDISAQKHGRCIRASVSSTHPAMLKLFKSLFKNYGVVKLYPKYDKRKQRYLWSVYCDLNPSFDFLLSKNENIPEWIVKDDGLFFAFLSGYFDAEGCLSLCYDNNTKSRSFQWVLQSCDKKILDEIVYRLNIIGFNLCNRLIKKADFKSYNKDFWGIKICSRSRIFNLVSRMRMKHEEKIMKYKLACELEKNGGENAREKIALLRERIKTNTKNCMG